MWLLFDTGHTLKQTLIFLMNLYFAYDICILFHFFHKENNYIELPGNLSEIVDKAWLSWPHAPLDDWLQLLSTDII